MAILDPDAKKQAETFVEQLRQHKRIIVVAHANPDGDAIGSILGAANICRQLGLDVTMFSQDPVPDYLQFLPRSDEIVTELDFAGTTFDAALIVDCGTAVRVGPIFSEHAQYKKAFVLDHHVPDSDFGDAVYNDTSACATGEMVYRVAVAAGVTFDEELATAIYTGISTDTGGFRFSNTNERSLGIAAEMSAHGAKGYEIARQLYERQNIKRLRMLADVLRDMTLAHDGRTASILLSQDLLRRHNAKMQMVEGFIDHPRSIEGVLIAVQYRQIEEEVFKVSFRSHGHINVQSLAATFNGGGHVNASGCRIEGPLADVRQRVEDAIEDLYNKLTTQ